MCMLRLCSFLRLNPRLSVGCRGLLEAKICVKGWCMLESHLSSNPSWLCGDLKTDQNCRIWNSSVSCRLLDRVQLMSDQLELVKWLNHQDQGNDNPYAVKELCIKGGDKVSLEPTTRCSQRSIGSLVFRTDVPASGVIDMVSFPTILYDSSVGYSVL